MTKKNVEENKELTIIDDINKNLIASNSHNLPLSTVFGRGITAKEESFGNRTLAENAMLVDTAMANMAELENIWNHSHSQWVWKHITMSWLSPYMRLKQVAAEMQRKRGALEETKWKQVKNEVKLLKLKKKLENTDLDYFEELETKIKIAEITDGMDRGVLLIEGAMKDVLAINKIYEELKELVDGFTEEELERQESKSHLMRSLMQSVRDIRERGVITKGEQEYMEQVGVNPSKMFMLLKEYVAKEAEDEWDTNKLITTIEKLVDELIDDEKVDVKRMETLGFDPNPTEGIGYHKKVAQKNGI